MCGERVCLNSFWCTKCQKWVHLRFVDVLRQVSLLSCQDVFVGLVRVATAQ